MSFKIRIILPFVGLCLLSHLTAQERSNQGISRIIDSLLSDISYLSDSLYGTDFSLINGEEYRNRHSGINGHPYYLSDSWLQGSVRSGEQEHQDLWLKYDIFDDRVILNHTPGSETFMIALNKDSEQALNDYRNDVANFIEKNHIELLIFCFLQKFSPRIFLHQLDKSIIAHYYEHKFTIMSNQDE